MNTYIGLDVGTSGCKASVVDELGHVLVTARREYHFECPGKGRVELNPDTVWNCAKETLKEIAAAGYDVRLLSVSSIGESMVMVDGQDRVLRNGIVYLDERGPETVDLIRSRMGEERMQRITGLPLRVFFSLNRYLWLREHEPEIVEQTEHYFLFGDYITYMLTGERMIDPSTASKTLMLDVMKLDWSKEIGDAFDVPLERFSKVVPTGTIAGSIRPSLAEETGLPKTLRVVVGCHDQCAATLGAGGVEPGNLAAGEGSTESLNLVVSRERITERFFERNICLEPYIQPGSYMVPVGQHVHGTSIRWFVKQFGADFGTTAMQKESVQPDMAPCRNTEAESRSVYEIANENCAADSGEVFFLPYLTRANLMDAENTSLGVFLGLEVGTGRAQMYRALLEGLCFETKLCFDILDETGFPINRIVAAGGCSKSELFMQMKADVLQRPVYILENADAGIAALAMICAVANGVYRDYTEAAKAFVRTKRAYEPQRDYSEKYAKYRTILTAVKALYNKIS